MWHAYNVIGLNVTNMRVNINSDRDSNIDGYIELYGNDNCVFCSDMLSMLKSKFAPYLWRYVDIDTKHGYEKAQNIGVVDIPSMILYNKDLGEVFRTSGILTYKQIISHLEK